jgi:hypothetical protein
MASRFVPEFGRCSYASTAMHDDASATAIFALRTRQSSLVHAARLRRGWNGRALCGMAPGGSEVWDQTTDAISCPACLRRLPLSEAAEPFTQYMER